MKAKTKRMPKIDLWKAGLTADERDEARRVLDADGRFRARPPQLRTDGRVVAGRIVSFPTNGESVVLWRLLAYYLSPRTKDQGTPDGLARLLDAPPADRDREMARIAGVARRMLAVVPRAEWHAFNYRASLGWTDVTGPVLH